MIKEIPNLNYREGHSMGMQRVADSLCREYLMKPLSVCVVDDEQMVSDGIYCSGMIIECDEGVLPINNYCILVNEDLWGGIWDECDMLIRLHVILHEMAHYIHTMKYENKGAVHGKLFRKIEQELHNPYGIRIEYKSNGYFKHLVDFEGHILL